MTLDINNLYNEKFYRDKQKDELEVCSICYSCGEVLYYGDEVFDFGGTLCCKLIECLTKTVGVEEVTLEKEED